MGRSQKVLALGLLAAALMVLPFLPPGEDDTPAVNAAAPTDESPYVQRFVPHSGYGFHPDSAPDDLPFKAVWVSAALRSASGHEGWYWAELMPAQDGSYEVNLRLQRNALDLESEPVPTGMSSAHDLGLSYDSEADLTTFADADGSRFQLQFGADAVSIHDAVVNAGTGLDFELVPLDRVLEWEFHDFENQKQYFFHSLMCTLSGTMGGQPVTGLVSLDMFWGNVGDGLWGEESVIFRELEEAWIIYYHQTPRGEPAYGTLFLGQGGWAGGYTAVGLGNAQLLSDPVIESISFDPVTKRPTSITVEPGGTFVSRAHMETLGEWGIWIRAVRRGSVEPQFVWWEHAFKPTDG